MTTEDKSNPISRIRGAFAERTDDPSYLVFAVLTDLRHYASLHEVNFYAELDKSYAQYLEELAGDPQT